MKNHNVLIKVAMILISNLLLWEGYGQITVFAGNDTSICPGEVLYMDDLNATISGAATDGTWFSLGDGYFTPSNSNTGVYNQVETYVPGPADISNGWFTLLLASDYGQQTQETDMVDISFQIAPTLACNAALNISLSDGCMQEVTPQLVLANPSLPYNRYIVTLYDRFNRIIPDAILTEDHIGENITVEVRHECDPLNSCWSEIQVEDKNPPQLICENDTIPCTSDILPETLGFPIEMGVLLEKIEDRKWNAYGLDACTDAILWYNDDEMDLTCGSDYERIIFRSWYATDEYGNQSSCIEEIYIRKDSLEGVVMPPHFDNFDMDALECGTEYPKLPNGHPHPDTTGYPSVQNCLNLEATFEDVPFEQCGNGMKVLREWWIIDWCTSESRNHNQVIKVLDTSPPDFTCPEDMTIQTDPYSCLSQSFLIPEELDIHDCSDASLSWTLYDSLDNVLQNGSNNYVAELPLGRHVIQYDVTDVCGNSASCTAFIHVVDRIAPQAVCDEFTSISIGVDGTARLFATSLNDGSHDNCGIVKQEVIKMTDECGNELERGEYVEFCCEEVGKELMVAYIVTDAAGNENTCMVTVEVEDKLPPTIVCPTDLTISCRYAINFDDLSEFGSVVLPGEIREQIVLQDNISNGIVGIDGIANDNCTVTVAHSYTEDLECSQGTILRTFVATDQSGLSSSCTQVITVVDENPFTLKDITWPDPYDEETCVDTVISPDISGEPTYNNTSCASIASTYKDKIFPFADGACMKIIREWTVIDWCQYDENENFGIWHNAQILKFRNTTAPTIISSVQDSLVCLYDESCLLTNYNYNIEVEDDCTSPEEMYYEWEIDLNKDDVIEFSGNSGEINEDIPIGIHEVRIYVEDRCGNSNQEVYDIEVKDCKSPTPYCITDLTTVLMHTNDQVEIWARDFNFNSSDNCTPQEELVFSFSSDTTIKSRTLTCDDIPNGITGILNLEMWVTDLAGNQEYCSVKVSVQDNNDRCEDRETLVMVGGTTMTVDGYPIDGVEVTLESTDGELIRNDITSEGNFLIDNVPGHFSIDITPEKLDNVDHGVSTLDIVLIQRHILGFNDLGSIEAEIAADVNGSGSISGSDLVNIRKLILGINDEFPNNMPSYLWYDASVIIDDENMDDLPANVSFSSLNDDVLDVNFIGIKIGDVDFSSSQLRNPIVTSRSNKKLVLNVKESGDYRDGIDFVSQFEESIQGFQLSLLLPDASEVDIQSDLPGFEKNNYHQIGNVLNIIWVANDELNIKSGDLLFRIIKGKDVIYSASRISLNTEGLQAEVYQDLHPISLVLTSDNIDLDIQGYSARLINNPVINNARIEIEIPEFTTTQIHLFSVDGALIHTDSFIQEEGIHEISIPSAAFPESGIYFINLQSGSFNKTLKLIKVD
ncbi:MAG: T9SS type A sorting domain-containing protein [Saprospiraceae bacterium]|nr:T9SS type A sorting domain-containing protein [Saprospiraceae bacterium]